MRRSRAKRIGDSGLFGGAGWLFADLMLAVVVAAYLASVIGPARPTQPPRPHRSAVTSTTVPPPTTTTPSAPERLDPDPITLDVDVDDQALIAGDPATVGALQSQVSGLLAPLLAGRRAGLVLTFGTASASGIEHAVRMASQFNALVLVPLGDQFRDSAYRGYFQGGADPHKITLNIWVFEP